MNSGDVDRRLAAVLCADVAGYTRMMRRDESGTLAAWWSAREDIIDPTLEDQAHRGRIGKLTGDGFLAEFSTAQDAVRCAVAMQAKLGQRNSGLPDDRRLDFRIGINVGDIVADDEDIYGDGVNIAARLCELAEPGGICISANVHEQVSNRLSLAYEDLGEQVVKNIDDPIRAYWVGSDPSVASASVPRSRRRFKGRRQATAWAAGLVIAAAIGAIWPSALNSQRQLADFQTAAAHSLPDNPSVAVLPFSNASEDQNQEYLSDGITEDIITDLAKLSGMFVIGRNSSFAYKGKNVGAQQVGRELGVRYVLAGSVRRNQNVGRISAQLVDTVSGNLLWAERHDRPVEDVFAMQDSISRKVVASLKVNFEGMKRNDLGSKSHRILTFTTNI